MSEEYVVLPKSQWKEILDAVRTKDGSEDLILSGELAEKILAITTGITPSGTLDITENGTHDVTEYAYAEVSVPVPDGYIVPSGTLGITANGTGIDVTQYAEVNVSVPVPSGYVKPIGTYAAYSNTSTAVDISSYKYLTVNVPETMPDGYVLPAYTFDYAEVTLDPGTGSGFSAGTYLPNGYMFRAAEVSGGEGGSGGFISNTPTDDRNISFEADTENMVGFVLWSVAALSCNSGSNIVVTMIYLNETNAHISDLMNDDREIEVNYADADTEKVKNYTFDTGYEVGVVVEDGQIYFTLSSDTDFIFSGTYWFRGIYSSI